MSIEAVLVNAAVALAGLVLSSLFSGMETGLYTINRVRLAVRSGRGEPAARILRRVLDDPPRMLATILVGNNIANYLGSFGIAAILDGAGVPPVRAIVINAALLIPLLFVFGEILPKDLFRTHTDRWSYRCARFLQVVEVILWWTGLVSLVRQVGMLGGRLLGVERGLPPRPRQRIGLLFEEGRGAGVLSEVQTTLADRALRLRDRVVADEAVRWADVVTVRAGAGRADLDAVLRDHEFTRYPVLDERRRVVGVLSMIDALLEPEATAEALMGPAPALARDMPVRDALRAMRGARAPMAIVGSLDRPLGIVTLKDLIEPLTGELAEF